VFNKIERGKEGGGVPWEKEIKRMVKRNSCPSTGYAYVMEQERSREKKLRGGKGKEWAGVDFVCLPKNPLSRRGGRSSKRGDRGEREIEGFCSSLKI